MIKSVLLSSFYMACVLRTTVFLSLPYVYQICSVKKLLLCYKHILYSWYLLLVINEGNSIVPTE